MIILLLLLAALSARAQQDSLLVVFWNVENFFDYRSGSGPEGWSSYRFYRKSSAIAKELLRIAESRGRVPDAVGFAEVENSFVLRQLVSTTPLRKLGYRIVHFESPDHRGMDCGLLYRPDTMRLLSAGPKHITDSTGAIMATRDILLAEFDRLSILVNHHPSKVGGKDDGRVAAFGRLTAVCDSLDTHGAKPRLAIGDFNEDRWGAGAGTIKYNGAWEKIDGCFHKGFSDVTETVCDFPELLTGDSAYGGTKPLRTFSGPRYLGGISDHLPIAVMVYF